LLHHLHAHRARDLRRLEVLQRLPVLPFAHRQLRREVVRFAVVHQCVGLGQRHLRGLTLVAIERGSRGIEIGS
jgi:hypothetical protein